MLIQVFVYINEFKQQPTKGGKKMVAPLKLAMAVMTNLGIEMGTNYKPAPGKTMPEGNVVHNVLEGGKDRFDKVTLSHPLHQTQDCKSCHSVDEGTKTITGMRRWENKKQVHEEGCKSCHTSKKAEYPSVPTKCGECHPKP
jgi:hypothetical protein